MAGPLDTRTTAQIEADNRDYLKKVKQIEEADKRAADKRDLAIIKSLKEQNKLTEEAFRTAKAQAEGASATSKGLDLVKGKVKEFFTGSLLGGIVQGLGVGIFGNVGSLVQQAFAPPTDEDLAQLARAKGAVLSFADGAVTVTTELGLWDEAMRRAAVTEIALRKETALAGEATKGYAKTIEDLTHEGEIELLRQQLELANAQWILGGMSADAAGAAVRRYRDEILGLEADAKKNTAVGTLVTAGIAGGAGKSGSSKTQAQLDAERKAAEERKAEEAARKARDEAFVKQWVQANIADVGAEGARVAALIEAEAKQIAADRARVTEEARVGTDDFFARAAASEQGMASDKIAKQQEQLAAMFGESSPFRGIDLVTKGFDALSQSAAAAFDALISGSDSAGAAFAKALGGMLKSDAIHAGVQALKEGAWALGSLAVGDAKGAALHGASAAKWALTAAAAGAGAALLGAGGGGSSSGGGGGAAGAGAGPGGYYGSGSGGDPNRGTERVIVVGDSNGSSSPRFEAVKARRYASLAGASSDRVRYE